MTNEANTQSHEVSADATSDALSNGTAATSAEASAETVHAPATKRQGPSPDAQEFARRMKEMFVSASDLACKGPQVAGDFVDLIRDAVTPKQKSALGIMLKQTVQRNENEVSICLCLFIFLT